MSFVFRNKYEYLVEKIVLRKPSACYIDVFGSRSKQKSKVVIIRRYNSVCSMFQKDAYKACGFLLCYVPM